MSLTTVRYRTSNYSDYLTQVASLIGVDQADLQTPELTMLNNFFNRAYRKIYESQLWMELCPLGEVRFPLDLIGSPNDFTNTTSWTTSAITVTANYDQNPLDNRQTASLLTPTAANSSHWASANINSLSLSQLPNQSYIVSGYARPNGYNYFQLFFGTGGPFQSNGTVWFNLSQPSPAVGTITNNGTITGTTASLQQVANGWFFWSVQYTTPTTLAVGTSFTAAQIYISSDGVNLTFTGNGQSGMEFWGTTLSLGTNQVPASYFIPYNQTGEAGIETVFSVWRTDPGNSLLPSQCNYQLTPSGINVIGAPNLTPYYLYYRPQRTNFTGTTFNTGNTYAVGQNIYFTSTNALTSGNSNYYTCATATSAGQSPDTQPTRWQTLFVPYTFLEFCVYNAYADWLQTEGQAAKAQGMYAYAQTCLDDENDKLERQNGNIMPWRVTTHLTSQQRGMGFQNQTYLPTGSYYVN